MTTPPPSKQQVLLQYLSRGVAMVHVDARRPGVVVPAQFAGEAHLRLNLSYRYGIPDLDIGAETLVATLSFSNRPFQCILPWTSVFGITCHSTGDGQVWPEDLPTEVMQTLASSKPEKPRLSAVTHHGPPGEPPPESAAAAPKRHLRLVR